MLNGRCHERNSIYQFTYKRVYSHVEVVIGTNVPPNQLSRQIAHPIARGGARFDCPQPTLTACKDKLQAVKHTFLQPIMFLSPGNPGRRTIFPVLNTVTVYQPTPLTYRIPKCTQK